MVPGDKAREKARWNILRIAQKKFEAWWILITVSVCKIKSHLKYNPVYSQNERVLSFSSFAHQCDGFCTLSEPVFQTGQNTKILQNLKVDSDPVLLTRFAC